MKILQLCSRIPFPLKDGGAIAMYNMALGLSKQAAKFSLFSLNTSKHFVPSEDISFSLPFIDDIKWVYVDNRIKPFAALLNLFGSTSYHAERFMLETAENTIKEMLLAETYDIIQLEGIYMANYLPIIRKYSKAKVVLRAHNIEHQIWERLAENAFGLKKWYLKVLTKRLKEFEIKNALQVDAITAITKQDAVYFKSVGCTCPIFVSPAGLVLDKFKQDNSSKEQMSIFHLGSLDWMPNREGVQWFLDEVWPDLHKKSPDLKFYIAGRNMPDDFIQQEYPNVKVLGEVEDAVSFMNSKNIMVVPLFSGSGMRVKIIEGMALGKVVIATPIGAEGLEVENGKHLYIASTPTQFVDHIVACLNNLVICNEIGNSARELIADKYDNTRLTNQLLKHYSQLVL